MKIRLLDDRVLIRPAERPSISSEGLHLVYDWPRSPSQGTVVALGLGPTTRTGLRLPHVVRVGETVVFAPDAGEEVFFEKETLVCVSEDQILAVIEGVPCR